MVWQIPLATNLLSQVKKGLSDYIINRIVFEWIAPGIDSGARSAEFPDKVCTDFAGSLPKTDI